MIVGQPRAGLGEPACWGSIDILFDGWEKDDGSWRTL